MLIAGIVFLAVGTVFQALGVVLRTQAGRYQRADGRITDMRHDSSREFGQTGFPVVTYQLPDGRTIIAEAKTAAAEDDGEVVGAEVEVGYDPADPETIVLGGGANRAAGTALLGLGFACDVIGVALLILSAL
jgi:hypothetical protein